MAKTEYKEDESSKKENLKKEFVQEVYAKFGELSGEIAERNQKIEERDQYVYGDLLERSLDIPIGHDLTSVNWLKRTVEIHKNQVMNRGFQVISTYDTADAESAADEQDAERISVENKKKKEFSEARKQLIDSIIEDNGGPAMFANLAENASAVGDAAIKMYYDEDEDKLVLSQIESIENLYALWSSDDFRQVDAYAYVHQVSKQQAIHRYGADELVATSRVGSPLVFAGNVSSQATQSNQPMVTVMEIAGKIDGWAVEKGRIKKVTPGNENMICAKIVGDELRWVTDDQKKIPKFYLFPNKRQRRRPWGLSDVSDAAININQTYIETLSDWRTHASKVNFQKYKAFGFGKDTQIPKSEKRKTQVIPLAEGQDLVRLDQGDSNQLDFRAQMEELKEQFVRETGVSRVLFDDPSVTLNSNQALLTSMKPTSDIAEAKKQLWEPVLKEMFIDALELISLFNKEIKDLVDPEERWSLKVMWPSIMQKEDPVYQQMLLNRFNAGTMSVQTYLEAQGETKEELDRIKEEMKDPTSAAILGRMLNVLAQNLLTPPDDKPQVKTNINLRGDLTPGQEANHATQIGINDGPFPASMGPQGGQGLIAQENFDNQGMLTGDAFQGGVPINRGPDGQPIGPGTGQKKDTNTGQTPDGQVNTQAQNQEGQGAVSQPGSGATPTSAQGAINQTNQNAGQ